jgi:hypothetical protein
MRRAFLKIVYLTAFAILSFGNLGCQTRGSGSAMVSRNSELNALRKREGTVREIECAAAQSVVIWDVAEVGVSSDYIGEPHEAIAKQRFLTPLLKENFLDVCDAASDAAAAKAQQAIAALGGTEESHSTKEESINGQEDELPRWKSDDRFSKTYRDGTCRCKDTKADKLNRPVYCYQEFSFKLKAPEDQLCYGYHVNVVREIAEQDIGDIGTREFCQKHTKAWQKTCLEKKDVYKGSSYFYSQSYEPLGCRTKRAEFYHPCKCSTSVEQLTPIAGARFYCTRTFNEDEVIINLDSPFGN